MMAIDRGGRYVTGDEMLTLFGVSEAKNMAVCPVDVSRMVDDVLPCPVHRTRVGDVYVAEEVKHLGADFGGESSGSWIFPSVTYCPDGIYAAARIVSIAAEQSISELIAQFPTYHVLRGSCLHPSDKDPMAEISQELYSLDYVEITTIDGVRLDFEKGWILVRKSGTEPKIRITAEAEDLTTAKELYSTVLAIVKRHT
jgi:phosphoglucosamine mutase